MTQARTDARRGQRVPGPVRVRCGDLQYGRAWGPHSDTGDGGDTDVAAHRGPRDTQRVRDIVGEPGDVECAGGGQRVGKRRLDGASLNARRLPQSDARSGGIDGGLRYRHKVPDDDPEEVVRDLVELRMAVLPPRPLVLRA